MVLRNKSLWSRCDIVLLIQEHVSPAPINAFKLKLLFSLIPLSGSNQLRFTKQRKVVNLSSHCKNKLSPDFLHELPLFADSSEDLLSHLSAADVTSDSSNHRIFFDQLQHQRLLTWCSKPAWPFAHHNSFRCLIMSSDYINYDLHCAFFNFLCCFCSCSCEAKKTKRKDRVNECHKAWHLSALHSLFRFRIFFYPLSWWLFFPLIN